MDEGHAQSLQIELEELRRETAALAALREELEAFFQETDALIEHTRELIERSRLLRQYVARLSRE
jgi:hypothetical protein